MYNTQPRQNSFSVEKPIGCWISRQKTWALALQAAKTLGDAYAVERRPPNENQAEFIVREQFCPAAPAPAAEKLNPIAQITGHQADALIHMLKDDGRLERRKGGFWTTPNCPDNEVTPTWRIPVWCVGASTVEALAERGLIAPIAAETVPPVYQLTELGRTFAPLIEEAISTLIPPHVPEGGYVELSYGEQAGALAKLIQRIRRPFERRRRA